MHGTKQNKKWKRYKKVDVPWAQYDKYGLNECRRILDLSEMLEEIDQQFKEENLNYQSLSFSFSSKYCSMFPTER